MSLLLRACRVRAVLLLPLILAGCGSADDTRPPHASAAITPSPASVVQRIPIPPARAIAVREGRVDDEPVTLELTQLRRRGLVVNLELRLRGRAGETALSMVDAFDDGVSQHVTDPQAFKYEGYDTVDGINLIDGINGRRYAPARDRFNNCLCDRNIQDLAFSRDRPATLSATFGAPPADVKVVDVVIPRFGTIPDVPLA